MSETWYRKIDRWAPVQQGELVFDCPIVQWTAATVNSAPIDINGVGDDELKRKLAFSKVDAVVLTQSCDIEQSKVDSIILGQVTSFESVMEDYIENSVRTKLNGKRFKDLKAEERTKLENSVKQGWQNFGRAVKSGAKPNFCLIENGWSDQAKNDQLLVDFHQIYTIPKSILNEHLQAQTELDRVALECPYIEYLSQSFGRFFMRVALPSDLDDSSWERCSIRLDNDGNFRRPR